MKSIYTVLPPDVLVYMGPLLTCAMYFDYVQGKSGIFDQAVFLGPRKSLWIFGNQVGLEINDTVDDSEMPANSSYGKYPI